MTVFCDCCTSVICYCAVDIGSRVAVYVELFGLAGRVIAIGAIERFPIRDERIPSRQLALLVYHHSDQRVSTVGIGIRWTVRRGCTTTTLKASDNLAIDHCPSHRARPGANHV